MVLLVGGALVAATQACAADGAPAAGAALDADGSSRGERLGIGHDAMAYRMAARRHRTSSGLPLVAICAPVRVPWPSRIATPVAAHRLLDTASSSSSVLGARGPPRGAGAA